MGSGSKGGSAQKSTNYYGTIALSFGWGPLDWLRAVISNGNYLFKNDDGLDLTADVTDLTGSLIDPSMVMAGGYVKLYRGTETQPADAALRGNHKGTIKLVAKHLFFGQESGIPPNIQMIGGRCPRVSTAIVAAVDNVVDDRQVNPIAAFAEYLTDERGAGFPEARLDASSWLATAHWAWTNRDVTFISPLITDGAPLRDVARALLEPIDVFCRWTPEGKLGCYRYEWGTNPGGLPLLDANAWSRIPKFTDGTWEDVPTEVVITYTDRDLQFQDNSVPVPNAAALKVRQVDDSRQVDRRHVMRRPQAARLGAEYIRRVGTAPGYGTLGIRAPLFSDLLPGAKVLVDVDPEPGGTGSAQLCRIEKITQDAGDEATLEVMTDGLLAPQSYTPNWPTPAIPPEAECAPIVYRQAIPLPLSAFDWPPAVAFLATRSAGDQLGFHVLFSSDSGAAYQELGWQGGFAVRAALAADISAGAGTANLTELDGLASPDAYLASATPGGNQNAAEDDTLLVVLATLDEQNRIALDGDNQPVMEFASILQRSAVSGATFTYTLLRGRLGTTARAWTAASAIAWIVPRSNLVEWRHKLLEDLLGAAIYFQLQSFTKAAADASVPLPSANLKLPTIPPPTTLVASAGTGKTIGLKWTPPAANFTGEYGIYRSTNADFSGAEKLGEVSATRFVDVEVNVGTTYYYKIVVISPGEQASTWSNLASATPSATYSPPGAPSDPSPLTLNSSGTYPAALDGTLYGWLKFNVPSFSGEFLSIWIVRNGSTGLTLVNQVFSGGSTTTIDDLATGGVYHVYGQAFNGDQGSGLVEATASPFTVPNTTTGPASGTSFSIVAGDTTAADRPPPVTRGTIQYACRVIFEESISKELDYYETGTSTSSSSNPSITVDINGSEYPCPKGQRHFDVYKPTNGTCWLWQRGVGKSGIRGNWTLIGEISAYLKKPAGDLLLQNASAVAFTGGTFTGVTEWAFTSARRFKKKIRPLGGRAALRELARWTSVVFDWRTKDVTNDVGFVADQIAKVRPSAVYRDEQGYISSLDYTKPVPLLVAAVVFLSRQLAALVIEVRALRKTVKKLERNHGDRRND